MKYTPTKSEIRKYIIRQVRERPGVIFADELNFIEKDLKKLDKLEKIIKEIKDTYDKNYDIAMAAWYKSIGLTKLLEVFENDK